MTEGVMSYSPIPAYVRSVHIAYISASYFLTKSPSRNQFNKRNIPAVLSIC